jgi:hypothetical protein
MSLDGISLLEAPTSVAWTAGTATVFEHDGTPVATGIRVADLTETDLRLQKHCVFKNKNTQMQSDGSFSKIRKNISFTIPFELADGSISYQVFRGEFELHPEFVAVAGNVSNLRNYAGQIILDSETDNYYNHNSVK